eukprot:evm.model.scf_840.6 EVM.evm.TU.scf_840.6   scf_840:56436-62199(-)
MSNPARALRPTAGPRALGVGESSPGVARTFARSAAGRSWPSNGQHPLRHLWSPYAFGRAMRRHPITSPFAFAPINTALAPAAEEDLDEEVAVSEKVEQPARESSLQEVLERQTAALNLNGKAEPEVISVQADAVDESLAIANLNLSPSTIKALEKKGITALFPIQKHVFDPASQGRDLIVRAKTGSGKTLAFALPVIENILKEHKEQRPRRGRAPHALVMAPTRELANQVAREVSSVSPSLSLGSFYGGVPVTGQKRLLADGVDVVVGTPGRLIDLIEQHALDLSEIKHVILDESDQMLDMGFEEDMESILKHAPEDRQTMLFSATLPSWVKRVSRKYLKDHVLVDLVGDHSTGRIAESIKTLGIMVDRRSKRNILTDLLVVHGGGEKSIVFTQTKREADYVASCITTSLACEALHGDIPQQQRELTLDRFRKGRFSVLVATDVAARGLDIPNVDLVVHYDMPQDSESFLHRSGRTGRAGKTGVTIVMFARPEGRDVQRVLKETHTKMELIGPPPPREVMQASTKSVLTRMSSVEPEVVKFFGPAAEKLLTSGDAQQVLAAALASMSGFDKVPRPRSLLTQEEGLVTLRVSAKHGRIRSTSHVMRVFGQILGDQDSRKVGRIELVMDNETNKEGALVDLPADLAISFLQKAAENADDGASKGLVFDRPKSLPMSACMPNRDYYDDGNRRQGRGRGGRGDRSNSYSGRFNGYSDRNGSSNYRGRRDDAYRNGGGGGVRRGSYGSSRGGGGRYRDGSSDWGAAGLGRDESYRSRGDREGSWGGRSSGRSRSETRGGSRSDDWGRPRRRSGSMWD